MTKRRILAWMLAFFFVFGGLAACSDDEDDGGDDTEEDSGDSGSDSGDSGDSGSGGNSDVQAYCDAVEEYVAEAQEALDDPASADTAALTEKGTELADQAAELSANAADLTPEDSQALSDCSTEAASALTP
jgi:hypothetical protein